MRFITLLRHGHCDTEGDDPSLTEEGQRQAEITREALKNQPFTGVYCSPLARAVQTATIVSDIAPIIMTELEEGTPTIPPLFAGYFAELARKRKTLHPQAIEHRRAQLDAAFDLLFQPSDRNDLVVCHGMVIRYLVCRALNIDPHTWVKFVVGHCSLTRIVVEPDHLQAHKAFDERVCMLLNFNTTHHLPTELQTN